MRTSTPAPDPQMPGRLGVNPRRLHVKDGERKRVKTACNNCNVRRIRCSGEIPCAQCAGAQRKCEYPLVDKKVFVPQSRIDELQASRDALESCLAQFIPDPTERQNALAQSRQMLAKATGTNAAPVKDEEFQITSSPAASVSTVALSPTNESTQCQFQQSYAPRKFIGSMDTAATEGSLLQDRDGTKRWLGGTSGATFLDHLKKFMHTLKLSLGYSGTPTDTLPGMQFLASRGQYQTSDSRLLFMPAVPDNIDPFSPSGNWDVAESRLAKVSEHIQDYMGGWACGGIHYFGDFYPHSWACVQRDSMNANTPPRRELAFYEAAFALGTVYSLTTANSRRDGQLGELSFAKARKILGDQMDILRYGMSDVPTLALMAMYMSEMNRRDNAYVYLSHALTVCCMFGGLKGSFCDERDRRIVWTLFCLAKDASCLMGRPPLYPDEAFQLAYPTAVPGLPPPDGLIAHIELSKIAGYIVSNTYSIAPRENVTRFQDPVQQVDEPLRMLDQWRERLPPNLQIPLELPPELQIPLNDPTQDDSLPTDRALFMLHMKWNQLLILTLRPLFFLAVKSSVGGDFLNSPRDMLEHPGIEPSYILRCSAAARRNLRLGRHIYERYSPTLDSHPTSLQAGPTGKLVMLDLHHIFNAAVVLLLHQMVFSNVINTDTIGIRAARQIFENEARTECLSPTSSSASAATGSAAGGASGGATGYASDCLAVLNDLAALVARIRPLRFKGSEHAGTGVEAVVGWGSPLSPLHHNDDCSVGATLSGSPSLISEEQLAANLSLENPFGPGGLYSGSLPMVFNTHSPGMDEGAVGVGVGMGMGHTNQKELEKWVQEGLQVCGLTVPLGGYTGM